MKCWPYKIFGWWWITVKMRDIVSTLETIGNEVEKFGVY